MDQCFSTTYDPKIIRYLPDVDFYVLQFGGLSLTLCVPLKFEYWKAFDIIIKVLKISLTIQS